MIHTVKSLDPDDCTVHSGIPVTAPARTLLDLAASLPADQFTRAYEEADRLGLVREKPMRALLARSNGHRGITPLTAMVDEAYAIAPTRSEFEHLFARLCDSAELPRPKFNVLVEGFTVDACWPTQRVVVELIGTRYHYTRGAVDRDRDRELTLRLANYEVLELTWKQVTRRPELVLALLRAVLS